ncbi:hypothetical protein XFF6992_270037 [Xanthomonas citri pv. fuscans]|nr:hypothetical protein XFF6992_270037 [Xanthomonas citri pv. fuscans]
MNKTCTDQKMIRYHKYFPNNCMN